MSDRPRIRDALARCFFAYDQGDGDAMAECFVADGELLVSVEGQGQTMALRGRAEIAEFCRKSFGARTEPVRHLITNTFVERDGNQDAVVVSYHTTVATRGGRPEVALTGFTRDAFVFEDSRWRILKRDYHCDQAAE